MLGKLQGYLRQRPWRAFRHLIHAACYGTGFYGAGNIGPVHLGIDWVAALVVAIGYLIFLLHIVLAVWMICCFDSLGRSEGGRPHRPTLDDNPFRWRLHSTVLFQDAALQTLFLGLGAITASLVSGWIAIVVGFGLLAFSAAFWLGLTLVLKYRPEKDVITQPSP